MVQRGKHGLRFRHTRFRRMAEEFNAAFALVRDGGGVECRDVEAMFGVQKQQRQVVLRFRDVLRGGFFQQGADFSVVCGHAGFFPVVVNKREVVLRFGITGLCQLRPDALGFFEIAPLGGGFCLLQRRGGEAGAGSEGNSQGEETLHAFFSPLLNISAMPPSAPMMPLASIGMKTVFCCSLSANLPSARTYSCATK